jgi:hypothetical protein
MWLWRWFSVRYRAAVVLCGCEVIWLSGCVLTWQCCYGDMLFYAIAMVYGIAVVMCCFCHCYVLQLSLHPVLLLLIQLVPCNNLP